MRVRLETPEMTEDAVPGMFFMLRNSGGNDPLIGRALALYDLSHEEGWVDLVYLVKGKLTTSISRLVQVHYSASGDRWAMALLPRLANI
ncbi:MAG: hypothetical protein AAF483_28780 [Planctomycetota bacterium]